MTSIARFLTKPEVEIYFKGARFLGDSNARLASWSHGKPINLPTPANDPQPFSAESANVTDHPQKASMWLNDKDYQS